MGHQTYIIIELKGNRRENKGQRLMVETHLRGVDVITEEYKIKDKSNRIADYSSTGINFLSKLNYPMITEK